MSEVVGLFDSRQAAERATERLYSLGYDATNVGYIDRYRDETGEIITDPDYTVDTDSDRTGDAGEEAAKGAGGGAIGGAAVGAGAGLLASAGLLLIPGIGPFLAAGTVAGTLGATAAGAAGGAVIGGAAGAIFGAATDDDTASYYRQGVDRGDSLVTVDVMDGRDDEVADVLRDAGAMKVDSYGDTGWV
ncbi:MAG TPA: hypothetical protein VHL52_00370 [Acidimicrobiia bacterium]|nr:hypothetical protein [Acidimicrobiia bacterium]